MQLFYNIGIKAMSVGIKILSFFNEKAKKSIEGRKHTFDLIKKTVKKDENWVWIHCSSLGEFEQGRPVIETLKKKHSNYKIALSFFSPSGYEIRKNYNQADLVFYIPFDTPKNAKKLLQVFKPKLWILVKYDYWYNHLKTFKKANVPIIVISSIFRENQIYFKPYGKWFTRQLKENLAHFFIQNEKSKNLLQNIDINQVSVVGDTRFDRVWQIADNAESLSWVETFKNENNLIVIGSSWKEDEDLWIKWINEKLPNNWKVIIAPHEMTYKSIIELKNQFKVGVTTYKNQNDLQNSKVLIVDAIGFLSKIYAYADMAYVGGGFNKSGVHNTLEPAVFGVPIIIGPHYQKFNEVLELKNEGVILPIKDYTSFEQVLDNLINSELSSFKPKAKKVFDKNLGATNKILNWIEGL
ncbi:3-deoxy-D-manno-octulosonic acid transferase [Weeksellaceae bacterium TAE3-ERU29]|nr:3-deoxy-D-manno-octulosonic acid transferase [Weeksellaceae bacterium TAE3-ERU29]